LNKVALIFLSMVFLLTACQPTDSNVILLEEVLSSFEEQELSLKESKVNDKNIFGMKLNGVRPSVYELDGKMLSVYIYDSTKEREKGLEDFRDKTASADVVSYNYYEVKNVLLFYVHELDLSLEVEVHEEIQKVVNELDKD
jgi:hypothetical protein